MNGLRFNLRVAKRVFWEAHEAYTNGRLLYSRIRLELAPQNTCIPQGVAKGSREHISFLYFTTLITYAADSDMVFRQSLRLFGEKPSIFSEKLLGLGVKHVSRCLGEVGFIRPEQGALYWHGSGTTLFQEYQGDPLRLLAVRSVDEFLLKKQALKKQCGEEKLPGIGPKIFSLMALFFEELGLSREMPGAFPVDLHVQRFCISTGIAEGRGIVGAASFAEFLRPRIYEICRELGMRPLDLSHALWFLGNRVCTRCPLVEGLQYVCPVASRCGGAIPSLIYSRKGKWNLDAPRLEKGSRQSSLFDDEPEMLLDAAEHGRRVRR